MGFTLCWSTTLGLELTLNSCDSIQWHTTGENGFFFASGYQLQLASWLGMGSCVCFPSGLALHWPEPGQVLWVLLQPLSVNVCISPVVSGRHCFLGVIQLWLLQSFWLLFGLGPWALRRWIWWKHSIQDWVLQSLLLLVQLCFCVLILINCMKKVFWWWVIQALIYGYSSMSLGVIYCYVPLAEE